MRTKFFARISLAFVAMMMVSCGEDTPAPVVEIFFEADADDGYTVTFTASSQNASSWSWDFGDDNMGTGESVTHTYASSGDYTVRCTATGDGGESIATKEVNIAASLLEMISGGPSATNGKTWVLSRTATTGVDGAGSVDPSYPADLMPGTDNLLDIIGLGAEYDNEYTFYYDGTYSVNNVNGNHLAGWVFSAMNIPEEDWVTVTDYGIFAVKATPSENATWTITENTDLVIDAVDETPEGGNLKTVTFEDADYITWGNGGFIALQDFAIYTTIREVASDRMTLSVFMHSVMAAPDRPSHIITLSYDVK